MTNFDVLSLFLYIFNDYIFFRNYSYTLYCTIFRFFFIFLISYKYCKLFIHQTLSTNTKKNEQRKPSIQWAIQQALNKFIDKKTNTGWTSGGHTAIDVPVFAIGAEKHRFAGSIDNTDIAKKIFKLLAEN